MWTEDKDAHEKEAIAFNKAADPNGKMTLMTGQAVICFKPHLDEPREQSGKKNYEVTVAIPADSEALEDIVERVKAYQDLQFGKNARKLKKPFKLGKTFYASMVEAVETGETDLTLDEVKERYEYLQDMVFFNAKTKYPLNTEDRPAQLIDHNGDEYDPKKVFGGAIVRIQVAPFKFDVDGNRGVTFGLRAVQVLKASEFTGQSNAAAAFSAASGPARAESAAAAFSKSADEGPAEEEVDEAVPAAVEATGDELSDESMFD